MGAAGDTVELPGVTVACPVLWIFWLRCSGKRPIPRPSEKHDWTVTGGGVCFQGMKALIKLL